jgi:hypothetical protein
MHYIVNPESQSLIPLFDQTPSDNEICQIIRKLYWVIVLMSNVDGPILTYKTVCQWRDKK